MKKIKNEDLNILSNELYQLAIANLHLTNYIQLGELALTAEVREQIFKKLVSLGDKSFYDSYQENSLWSVCNFHKGVTASKVVMLINQLAELIENFNELDDYALQKGYRNILETLIEMITNESGQTIQYTLIKQLELRKKIEAYVKIKARYEKKLYPKHKIFFDILKKRADRDGKWKNPNKAVHDVYNEVIAKFEEVDRNFIGERLVELESKKNILLEKIKIQEQVVENGNPQKSRRVQDPEDDPDRFYAKRRLKKLVKQSELIHLEILKYTHALKGGYPFISLGREILFNSDIELSLINCLRNEKELVKQIIIPK